MNRIAGESLFNDGTAYVVFLIVAAVAFSTPEGEPVGALGALVLALSLSGCSDQTGLEGLVLTGTWTGTVTLPNGYTTSMNLSQTSTNVSGTMTIAGSFVNRNVTGTVDADTRGFAWAVLKDCEVWGGVLTVSGDGSSMEGPVLLDRTGCVGQSNVSGMLRLTRS